jgi:nitrate/nitrite transport system substrate-binding protein
MVLSNNGSAILLSSDYKAAAYGESGAAARMMAGRTPTFGITFPGGTHDIWLRYWFRASGVDARRARILVVPPPRMVTEMKVGPLQGSCVGEPWSAMAAAQGVAFTHLATQDLWTHHPEKALVVEERFAAERPEVLRDLMGAVLRACAWLDDPRNHDRAVETLAAPLYVGAAPVDISDRLSGRYRLGAGLPERTFAEDRMRFFRDGWVNAPRRAHGLWFLAQYRRLGLLQEDPPYRELVDDLVLRDLYEDVAEREGISVPDDDLSPFGTKLDGALFDPSRPGDEVLRR